MGELPHGFDHVVHLFVLQFRVHGQGKNSFRHTLRVWKIARPLAQVLIHLLQVERPGIIDDGRHSAVGQKLLQLIPPWSEEGVYMEHMAISRRGEMAMCSMY